jgi:hypothetical protein
LAGSLQMKKILLSMLLDSCAELASASGAG